VEGINQFEGFDIAQHHLRPLLQAFQGALAEAIRLCYE
jgi:hypothetical protein